MAGGTELRRIEQWLSRLRWLALLSTGAVAGFCIFLLTRGSGNSAPDPVGLGAVLGLAAIVAVVAGAIAERLEKQAALLRRQTGTLAEGERLLAVTAHEMRGPLSAVIGAVETVLARPDALTTKQRAALLGIASRQSNHLAVLIDDLLVTTRLQTGGLALELEWTDLQAVAESALEAAKSNRRDHRVEVFVEPFRCKIDPARTIQVVRNLIENAYKYSPERSTVWLRANCVDGELVLQVADEGSGIPADQHHRLFEPFDRIAHAGGDQKGIGIGLHVVNRLVEAMGGRIDLVSSPTGTTFTLRIPCEGSFEEPRRLSLVRVAVD